MKPLLLPNWLAFALIAGFLFLGAYMGGPDEIQAAQDVEADRIEAIAAAQAAGKVE